MAGNYGMGVRLDLTKLRAIERSIPGAAERIVGTIAVNCEGYLKTHMSESPSREGEPPGIDTGTLVNAIRAAPKTGNGKVWEVDMGTEYSVWLEYGTVNMGARPYALPAIGWTMANIPSGLLASIVEG